jgi:hypothetical protein
MSLKFHDERGKIVKIPQWVFLKSSLVEGGREISHEIFWVASTPQFVLPNLLREQGAEESAG